jgi:thiol-disulfide isomerase/thioredoxin
MIKEIRNLEDHDEFIKNNTRGVIFFGSKYCPHCQEMEPVVKDLAKQYPRVKFAHVETTEVNVENVGGVPSFVGYKNREAVGVVLGADTDKLIKMITTKLK